MLTFLSGSVDTSRSTLSWKLLLNKNIKIRSKIIHTYLLSDLFKGPEQLKVVIVREVDQIKHRPVLQLHSVHVSGIPATLEGNHLLAQCSSFIPSTYLKSLQHKIRKSFNPVSAIKVSQHSQRRTVGDRASPPPFEILCTRLSRYF